MGTISSGVGLISGMDIDSLVTQLMAIEARPLNQLKTQISAVQQQQSAYSALCASVLAIQNAINALTQPTIFGARTATSSNTAVLSAIAGTSTPVGTYSFQVRSLATTHQLVSAGFADRDSTPLAGGTLTFKPIAGRVDTSTLLGALNGAQGVRGGIIRITDRAGGTADIDLTGAVSVDDVLQAINSQSTANVSARVEGDHLVITDQSGATTGALQIQDLAGGSAAADLGIAGSSATGEVNGRDVLSLGGDTRLAMLNDGLGVRASGAGNDDVRFTLSDGREISVSLSGNMSTSTKLAAVNDGRGAGTLGTIRITNRSGQSADISLAGATTIGDVMQAISAGGQSLGVGAVLAGSKLVVSDGSGGKISDFKIEDVTGNAAAMLGIAADTTETSISSGVLYRMDNIGAVMRAIQYADGNNGALVASISADGNGIALTDTTGQDGITVEALNGSLAARDLGLLDGSTQGGGVLQGRDVLAGLNTVLLSSLNGGAGVGTGVVEFTRTDGTAVQVDFTGVQTLSDIIARINTATDALGNPAGLSASIETGGTGITITDGSLGSGTLSVRDLSGSTAADMHWAAAAGNRLASGDLNRQYISENTQLSSLHQGKGIAYGSFTITAANGVSGTVTLNANIQKTVGDVIKAVNSLNMGVTARINANGDGIELVDNSGGTGTFSVTQQSAGTTAADLRILGQAQSGSNVITGSFTSRVTIAAGDTLDAVVQKINSAGAGVTARVINDGSAYAPYRLVISSTQSGKQGEIAYDTGTTGLSLGDMTRAHDAVVAMTDGSSPNPILISSGTNSVTGVVDGLTLNLTATSSQPVSVAVAQDTDSIVQSVQSFVDAFNKTVSQIADLTKYNSDTQQKGVLLGDYAVRTVSDKLYDEVNRVLRGSGLKYTSLSQIGIKIGTNANLTLDEEKLTAALQDDPDAVRLLFALTTKDSEGKTVNQGIGVHMKDVLTNMTQSTGGLFDSENKMLQDKVDLFNRRATDMQALLDQKQARLYAQFQAMESALAQLQNQQAALASLSSLFTSTTSTTT
jgi:flagellar hook-associated protein 2